jgi:hypothetical protein
MVTCSRLSAPVASGVAFTKVANVCAVRGTNGTDCPPKRIM